jgi:release factor glutamine methyltransferase
MSTIAQTLQQAALALDRCSDSPRLDAELLLGKLLGQPRSGLIARSDEPVAAASELAFADLIEARRGGAPVAYLTGSREFWSLPLTVTPAVLVPRPETELLVELALQLAGSTAECSVLDLGTGSGAIALALASERPRWRITGVDVSPPALEIARRNACELGLSQVEWRVGSWFEAVAGERFNLILANPPYVAAGDPALENFRAEPAIALVAGPTGLDALGAIAAAAVSHLNGAAGCCSSTARPRAGRCTIAGASRLPDIRSHLDFSGKPASRWELFTHHIRKRHDPL